ncbi:MAG: hypothetical protein NTW94_04365 [Legionellales bacterium]|nr:hypothetical protein [Legionellales bacterium]
MITKKSRIFLIVSMPFMTFSVYALPMWTLSPLTQTTISTSPNVPVIIQYVVTNQSERSRTLAMKPITGITQSTSAGFCSSPFTLAPHQSCTLTLSTNGIASSSSIEGGPTICLASPNGNPNPNQCYQPCGKDNLNISFTSGPLSLYQSDFSANLWKCPISDTGDISGGACAQLTNSPPFSYTDSSTFGTFSGATYTYVGDNTTNLWQCPIDALGNFSGNCTSLSNTTPPGFNVTFDVTFATFSGNTYAYVTDNSNTLWKCLMNATGGFSGGCTALTNSSGAGFQSTEGVTFMTYSGTTYGYVSDASHRLWKCPMDENGNINSGACTALTNSTGSHFVSTSQVVFATFAGTTYLYVNDDTSTLWKCPINESGDITGGACAPLVNINGGFAYSTSLSFAMFLGTTYGYEGDASSNLWKCPMTTTGDISGVGCTALNNSTSTGFSGTDESVFRGI